MPAGGNKKSEYIVGNSSFGKNKGESRVQLLQENDDAPRRYNTQTGSMNLRGQQQQQGSYFSAQSETQQVGQQQQFDTFNRQSLSNMSVPMPASTRLQQAQQASAAQDFAGSPQWAPTGAVNTSSGTAGYTGFGPRNSEFEQSSDARSQGSNRDERQARYERAAKERKL